ncbi:unnamed protein product [Pleuronectes platessa]|uniref:Uncharacterized protein n=1 Tax=Pleuronectes platessa TaxID=8262 RepID=A0A9N7UJB9_PLEPL|nr:unnamed protein product [Pleuronectes platessa]
MDKLHEYFPLLFPSAAAQLLVEEEFGHASRFPYRRALLVNARFFTTRYDQSASFNPVIPRTLCPCVVIAPGGQLSSGWVAVLCRGNSFRTSRLLHFDQCESSCGRCLPFIVGGDVAPFCASNLNFLFPGMQFSVAHREPINSIEASTTGRLQDTRECPGEDGPRATQKLGLKERRGIFCSIVPLQPSSDQDLSTVRGVDPAVKATGLKEGVSPTLQGRRWRGVRAGPDRYLEFSGVDMQWRAEMKAKDCYEMTCLIVQDETKLPI